MSLPEPDALERAAERRDRGAFFFGFALALLVAVPIALLGLRTLADNVTGLLIASVGALLGVGLLGTLVFWFRRRIFRGALGGLMGVYAPVPGLVERLRADDRAGAAEQADLVARRFVAWYGWVNLRNWIVRALIGVVAGFAALLGSVLLWEQNRLLLRQNDLIEAQNAYFQRQIGQDSEQWAEVRRGQLRTTLVEVDCREGADRCRPVSGPVARGQALAALAGLERQAGRLPLELYGLDLREADLRGVNLADVRLVDCDLRGALLDDARLVGARLPGSDLSGVALRGAWVSDADWLETVGAGPDGVDELDRAAWRVCPAATGFRLQPSFPGCEGQVVTARPTAAVREGRVRLGPAASDIARIPLGAATAQLNCSTQGGRLLCELAIDGRELATRLHWGPRRLMLQPTEAPWSSVAIEIPPAVYGSLRLDRFNR